MERNRHRIALQLGDWASAFTGPSALRIRYAEGELIRQTGSYIAGVHLVTAGIVRESLGKSGGTAPGGGIEILGPGDLMGIEILLGRGESLHMATSRAVSDVELSFLARDTFADAVDQDVALRWQILHHLAERHLSGRCTLSWNRRSAQERMCHLLLDLGRKLGEASDGGEVCLPGQLDLRAVAELLGISASQARRVRSSLPSLHEQDRRLHFSIEALEEHLPVAP